MVEFELCCYFLCDVGRKQKKSSRFAYRHKGTIWKSFIWFPYIFSHCYTVYFIFFSGVFVSNSSHRNYWQRFGKNWIWRLSTLVLKLISLFSDLRFIFAFCFNSVLQRLLKEIRKWDGRIGMSVSQFRIKWFQGILLRLNCNLNYRADCTKHVCLEDLNKAQREPGSGPKQTSEHSPPPPAWYRIAYIHLVWAVLCLFGENSIILCVALKFILVWNSSLMNWKTN